MRKRTGLLVASIFCTVMCGMARQSEFTRGIGIYPGRPTEDFSPVMKPDHTYRNIALHRAAYGSSSYDYNLTAQWLTDGVTTTADPSFLEVSIPAGPLARREREWAIDRGEWTRNILMGADTYLQYDWHNAQLKATQLTLTARVAYDEKKADSGYEIACLASQDGVHWTKIGGVSGHDLPGKAARYKVHSDPNKATDTELLPLRLIDLRLPLKPMTFSHLKVCFKMKGAAHWTVTEANAHPTFTIAPRQDAWMSADAGEQWVYVDLGVKADFDKVILHWIHKAAKGQVQVSDDAVTWRTISQLSLGSGQKEIVRCSGSGRFVRVLMQAAEPGAKCYVLSELEVMGRGGLTAVPKAEAGVSGGKYYLNGGDWRLQRSSQVAASGEQISRLNYDTRGWIQATVPATVQTSYVNIGALPNPNYADNLLQISDAYFNTDFWYRREFRFPALSKGRRVLLNFDGINWKADVFLNGKRIDRIEGAFIRGCTDITNVLQPGINVLAVRIICNAHPGSVKEKNALNTDFNGGILGADNPTFHATIGWDWISTIRGRDIGIWNDVYLSTSGTLKLADPLVTTHLSLPDTLVTMTPAVCLTNSEDHAVSATVTGRIGHLHFTKDVTVAPHSRQEVTFSPDEFAQLRGQRMRLWWPNGYGQPYRYDAGFEVKTADGISDSLHFKVGLREVAYRDTATQLKIYVNGRRIVPLGGNWGFSESNLNYRTREYDAAVRYHKEMHFNMIRNWVGQTGDDEFYDACDRYGILVWQDFWLANPSDGPDPADERMFLANARDLIHRIRRHPSIAIYCGRNEGYPPESLDQALRTDVAALHPNLLYISSSADEGVSGHGPYNALAAKEYFEKQTGKLHTERGMPAVMTFEGLVRTLRSDQLWPQNAVWGQHDYTMGGAQRGESFNSLIERGFGTPKNARDFTTLAQWINYNGYRAMFESTSKDRQGLLIWMSHPCWPTMVWQTYDYYLEPTAAYFGAKKACEPLHIQWNPLTRRVEIISLRADSLAGFTVCATMFDKQGKRLWYAERALTIGENTTVTDIAIADPSADTGVYFIDLQLLDERKQLVSENFYVESTVTDNFQGLKLLPVVGLNQTIHTIRNGNTWTATLVLANKTATPALMIRLNLLGEDGSQILPVIYSDNYFSLLPGREKTITISWRDEDSRGIKSRVELSGYNVERNIVSNLSL